MPHDILMTVVNNSNSNQFELKPDIATLKIGKRSLADVETLIVGAGVVGLAIARDLSKAGQEVLVLEQHNIIGSETSARNSEVIHAGIYYPKDSLKALTCVRGKQLLYEFCQSHHVPHQKIGKLIVATTPDQVSTLQQIEAHARANGVEGLRNINGEELCDWEPNLSAMGALYSPSTGIIDSHSYMLALQGDMEAHGGQIAFNTKVESWNRDKKGCFEIHCNGAETVTSRNLIISGGLHASKLANAKTALAPDTQLAKGNYFKLTAKVPFSHLIYPVPEPGGLGVHLTLDLQGQARFGPDVEWVEEIEYQVDPQRAERFYSAIRTYWPGLPDNLLEPDYAGIRPKLVGQGEPDADFCIMGENEHGYSGLVMLLGMESPGLTASLAIAEHVRKVLPT